MPSSPPHRVRSAATLAVVLALAGCGVKATSQSAGQTGATTAPPATDAPGTSSTTSTTEGGPAPTDGPTTTDGTATTGGRVPVSPQVEQSLARAYVNLGLSQPQATCLAHEIVATFGRDTTKFSDFTAITALLDRCKISITDFRGRPGG